MSGSSKSTWHKLFASRHPHDGSGSSQGSQTAGPSSSNIRAYLRLRPSEDPSQCPNVDTINDNQVMAAPLQNLFHDTSSYSLSSGATRNSLTGRALAAGDAEIYTFSKVLEERTTQTELYDTTTLPLLQNLLGDGQHGTMSDALLLAYGVSGGGKTHTIQGTADDPGLLPRTLTALLRAISTKQSAAHIRPSRLTGIEIIPSAERLVASKSREQGDNSEDSCNNSQINLGDEYEYSVWATFVEVYNENIHDLLSIDPKPKNLSLKQDHKHSDNKFIAGTTSLRLHSEQHALEVLDRGLTARHRSATRQNETSSRSHSIFTLQVLRLPRGSDGITAGPAIQTSRMSIVDLAGSERARNTQTHGDRLKEAGKINQSLMVLGMCFDTIRSNEAAIAKGRQPAIVPFRHSKLTEVLKPYFCGHGETVIVAAMDPYRTALDENISVLRFSSLARQIKTNYSLPQTPSIITAQADAPHYQLPTRTPRAPRTGSIQHSGGEQASTSPVEWDARSKLDSAQLDGSGECGGSDEEGDGEEEDPFVASLFDEIRELRQDAVRKDIDHEMAIHRARQEERRRTASKLAELRVELEEAAFGQRALAEELMNKKIDNLKATYEHIIAGLEEQLESYEPGNDDGDVQDLSTLTADLSVQEISPRRAPLTATTPHGAQATPAPLEPKSALNEPQNKAGRSYRRGERLTANNERGKYIYPRSSIRKGQATAMNLDDANPTCVPSDVPIINVVSPKKSGSPLPPRTYRLAETPSAFVERYKKTPPKHRGTITCAPSVTGPPDMPPIASERLGGYFDPSEDDKSLDMKDLGIALQAELNHVHFDTQSMLTQPGKDSADITACFKDPRAAFKASGRKATPHPIKRQTGTEHVNDNDDASGIDGEDDDDKDSDDGGQEEVNSTVDFKTA